MGGQSIVYCTYIHKYVSISHALYMDGTSSTYAVCTIQYNIHCYMYYKLNTTKNVMTKERAPCGKQNTNYGTNHEASCGCSHNPACHGY